jgi:hypothetical protein
LHRINFYSKFHAIHFLFNTAFAVYFINKKPSNNFGGLFSGENYYPFLQKFMLKKNGERGSG